MFGRGSVFGGVLLVAGTTIGGGMLGLPVLTAAGGFYPSVVVFFICWAFMCCTGLLYLECCEWMKGDTNIISMAGKTLGRLGQGFAWGVYLFLFYSLTLAYMVGCGDLTTHLTGLSREFGPLVFTCIFAPVVLGGARIVGRVNALMMGGLALSYFTFIFLGSSYIDFNLLTRQNWSQSLFVLPVAFAAFGFQGIVPTLYRYMCFNHKKTRQAIVIGSFLPLLCYILWEALILGVMPVEYLFAALASGDTAVTPLKQSLENPVVFVVGNFFAFFALTTSFYGVTLALFDFLADGLRVKKEGIRNLFLFFLVFFPPLIFAMLNPGLFLVALGFAGGFGGALLLGLLPILMVWSGRYVHNYPSIAPLKGGRILLSLLGAFVLFELMFELSRYLQ